MVPTLPSPTRLYPNYCQTHISRLPCLRTPRHRRYRRINRQSLHRPCPRHCKACPEFTVTRARVGPPAFAAAQGVADRPTVANDESLTCGRCVSVGLAARCMRVACVSYLELHAATVQYVAGPRRQWPSGQERPGTRGRYSMLTDCVPGHTGRRWPRLFHVPCHGSPVGVGRFTPVPQCSSKVGDLVAGLRTTGPVGSWVWC